MDALPAGACDCHTHVIGDRSAWPMQADRPYTPGPAPHEALLAHLSRVGLQRVVIVQPSVYGSDNRCMLASLARLEGSGRGIAVVDDDADDAALDALHRAGVRGLRLNLESRGVRDVAAAAGPLERWAARIAKRGWHLQLFVSHDTVLALAPVLGRLAVPVVLDHFALLPEAAARDAGRLRPLLALLETGNVHVKLSAPYRLASADTTRLADELAGALLAAHPDRMLWGSDWPHTDREPGKAAHEVSRYRALGEGFARETIRRWLPTEDLRQRVLVDNPAALYGF